MYIDSSMNCDDVLYYTENITTAEFDFSYC